MSQLHRDHRAKTVRTMGFIAGGLAAVLLALTLLGGHADRGHPRTGELVFPDLMNELGNSPTLRIQTADTVYTLKEIPSGWGLVESGGYPIRSDRMRVLADALRTLRWGDVKTRDPSKFDRIGLGDPKLDGAGALIEVLGEDDELLASLITGRKDERVYGRKLSDDALSFQLEGDLPPLYTRQAWLDLDILQIPPEVVKSVRIVRPNGDSLLLAREAGGGPRTFEPAPPNQDDRLISRLAAAGPALAITRFFPTDVKPASALKTDWVGRHITVTHDALEVDTRAYHEADGYYVTLRAVEAGNGANRAESINAKAEGWAFKLAEIDWVDFAPEISGIVVRAEE